MAPEANAVNEGLRRGEEGETDASGQVTATVEFPPDVDELPTVFEAVEEFGDRAGWSFAFAMQAQLVIEEMVLNVMNHSRATDPVVMSLSSRGGEAKFEIIDRGVPFDPTEVPTPPEHDASSLEDIPIGGLGIHLVRSMVREMRYRRAGHANHVTLLMEIPES